MWDFSCFDLTACNIISVLFLCLILVVFCWLVKKTSDVRISSCPNPDCARCANLRGLEAH